MRRRARIAFVLSMILALNGSAGAEEVMRHSGSIVAIADDARTFVLAEVGPWQVRNGATVITYRTITLLPQTQFAFVGRMDDGASGFRGNFLEVPLEPDAVYLHDYVTVECRHEGTRLLALKITVIEGDEPQAE
jgi:hypothetical protein